MYFHSCPFSPRIQAKLFLGDKDSFHVNHVYKDDDTYSVVAAATEVLGKPNSLSLTKILCFD